jgi:Ca2+-binding EF-hand superfamily protein
MKRIAITLAVAALGSSLAVVAADEPKQADAGAAFKQLDVDKDGFISKTEAERMKGLVAVFDAADENKDGKLDVAEFAKATATTKN